MSVNIRHYATGEERTTHVYENNTFRCPWCDYVCAYRGSSPVYCDNPGCESVLSVERYQRMLHEREEEARRKRDAELYRQYQEECRRAEEEERQRQVDEYRAHLRASCPSVMRLESSSGSPATDVYGFKVGSFFYHEPLPQDGPPAAKRDKYVVAHFASGKLVTSLWGNRQVSAKKAREYILVLEKVGKSLGIEWERENPFLSKDVSYASIAEAFNKSQEK